MPRHARGGIALNRRVCNLEGYLDNLFSQVVCDTIVVVDQCRNIVSLAISRARLAGLNVAYLPGLVTRTAGGCMCPARRGHRVKDP